MARLVLNILGFHRSGTSALAGQLNALGFPLGFDNEERSEENPKGFFEHPLVRRINDQGLGELKSAWFDWSLTPASLSERIAAADLEPLRADARAFLQAHFEKSDRLLIKDPRMMRMAWFWTPLFAELDAEVREVIIIRSPAECAASQVARAGRQPEFYRCLNTAEGMNALWCSDHRLMLDHLATSSRSTLIVRHAALLGDPHATLNALVAYLQLDPASIDIEAGRASIDPALHRQKHQKPAGVWGEMAERFYGALCAVGAGNGPVASSAIAGVGETLRELKAMQTVIAPASSPMMVAAERGRSEEAAVTDSLVNTLKLIGLAANRVPAADAGRVVEEIESLVRITGRRRLFLGPLATALLRAERAEEAKRVLEEILSSGRPNAWADEQLKELNRKHKQDDGKGGNS